MFHGRPTKKKLQRQQGPRTTSPSAADSMSSVSPPLQWPRGPTNELLRAVFAGSAERTVAVLLDGSIDIDHVDDDTGFTPLMIASMVGHSGVVRILLNKGANVSTAGVGRVTALHLSAQEGTLAVCKMLMNAGADLEAANSVGVTPLHLAASGGKVGIMSALIEAGSNPNSRCLDGATPLFAAAQEGHMDALKMLLRAKGDPLLTRTEASEVLFVPLDTAAVSGHFEVVRELVQQVGIEGCGGASGGLNALRLAAGTSIWTS